MCAHICVYTHPIAGCKGPACKLSFNRCHPSCFHSSSSSASPHSPLNSPLQSRGPVLGSHPDHTLNCHLLCAKSPSPPPPPLLLYAPQSPPCSNPTTTPPPLTNPCLASNHITPCSTWLCQTLLFFSELSTVELSLYLYG